MKSVVRILPLALLLAGAPQASRADTEAECRQMAVEDEVPAEDMTDYLAECMAAAESEGPDEGAPVGDGGEAKGSGR
jgi:hypothetical protein